MNWDNTDDFSSWSPSYQGESESNDPTSMAIPYQSSGSALFTEGSSLADELGWNTVRVLFIQKGIYFIFPN